MEQRKEIYLDGKNLRVSTLGRVQRLNEKSTQFGKIGEWYDMPIQNSRGGYLNIAFGIPLTKKTKSYLIHRLVGYAFLGLDIQDKKMCVCHKNDIRTDNRLENLFIGTYQDNIRDAVNKGRQYNPKGEKNGNSKYDKSFIKGIKIRLLNGEKPGRLYKEFGIPKGTMYDIKKGRLWGRVKV